MFKNHPKGLLQAALSNMGERFGYYIMNAVLVLFLCSKFGLSDEEGGLIYSFFYAGIYILSLVGGIIADRTQNYKATIAWGLVVMALGYVLLAIPILAVFIPKPHDMVSASTRWYGLKVCSCFNGCWSSQYGTSSMVPSGLYVISVAETLRRSW